MILIQYYDEILADTYYFNNNEDFNTFIKRIKSFKDEYLIKNKDNKFLKYNEKELLIIGSLIERRIGELDKLKTHQ